MLALDLFCGGGGACIGMQQAGFEVVGIDNKVHKNYPGYFIQADALHPPVNLSDFDFVWVSPPCQRFSVGTKCRKDAYKKHPDLIEPVRALLKGHPYTCIENVPHAPIRPDLILNGPSVGLKWITRKRIFETSFFIWNPLLPQVKYHSFTICANSRAYVNQSDKKRREKMGFPMCIPKSVAKMFMGLPCWLEMNNREIGEAVPPPYARYIAEEVIRQIKNERKSNYGKRDIRIT